MPALEVSYSIAPPRNAICRTSAPVGQIKDFRMLNLIERPDSLCILRLSAIGDTCHVVPVVRTLQRAWPTTALTWVIGRVEARLMSLLPGVEFITIDKRAGLRAARSLRSRAARTTLRRAAAHAAVAARQPGVDVDPRAHPARLRSRARARAAVAVHQCADRAASPRARARQLPGFLGALGLPEQARWHGSCRCRPRRSAMRGALIPDRAADADHQPLLRAPGAQLASRALRRDRRSRGAARTACA